MKQSLAFITLPALPSPSRRSQHAVHQNICAKTSHPNALSRRDALQFLSLLAISPCFPSAARAANAITTKLGAEESSDVYGYVFKAPPSGWTRTTADLSSFRKATIFVNDDDLDSNINLVVTPLPGDFQKLTSFGTLENVLQTIIPQKGKDIDGAVISTRTDTANNAYVIEYTITAKGEKRHLLTIFSLQPGRCLVTLTGQAKEENWSLPCSAPILLGKKKSEINDDSMPVCGVPPNPAARNSHGAATNRNGQPA